MVHRSVRFIRATEFEVVEDLDMPGNFGVVLGRHMDSAGRLLGYEITGMPRFRAADRVRIPLTEAAIGVSLAPASRSPALAQED